MGVVLSSYISIVLNLIQLTWVDHKIKIRNFNDHSQSPTNAGNWFKMLTSIFFKHLYFLLKLKYKQQ